MELRWTRQRKPCGHLIPACLRILRHTTAARCGRRVRLVLLHRRPDHDGFTGTHPGSPVPNLTHIPLKLTYRTGRDDLVHDFFVPCLETSVLYRRAAGYFTSAGLARAARGVASLALRRGRMRLVVSPYLEPDDCAALERAQENPAAVLRTIDARSLAEIEDALIRDRLNALAWLAAAGRLESELAMRLSTSGYACGVDALRAVRRPRLT